MPRDWEEELQDKDSTAAGSQFHGTGDSLAGELGQFVVLAQGQGLAIEVHDGRTHIALYHRDYHDSV